MYVKKQYIFIHRERNCTVHLARRTRGNDQKNNSVSAFPRTYGCVCKRTRATTGVDVENTMIYGVCIPANNAETLGLENLWSAFARMHCTAAAYYIRARKRINVNERCARRRGNYCSFFVTE